MRGTEVLLRQHIDRQFKVYWMIQSRRHVPDSCAIELLAAKGVPVINPKDILTPPYPKGQSDLAKELSPHIPYASGVPRNWSGPRKLFKEAGLEYHKEPCFVFGNRFSPVFGVPQAQLLTNTLVRWSLPQAVLDHATPTTPEEDDRVQEAILHAHLMDTTQKKLTRILDPINRPGWIDRREYGIPLSRINKTLTYQLLLLLDQSSRGATMDRMMVEDTITRITLRHAERLMQFEHFAGFTISSPRPLPRLAGPEEVAGTGGEEMPDLYPASPFVSVLPPRTRYSMQDQYGVPVSSLHPHTIIIHENAPRLRCTPDGFVGRTLLYAFSHAAAYAKSVGKCDEELTESPVVVQVVHCNRQQYQVGVLQLNTLDPTRPDVRNIFWTQPWQYLFSSCMFRAALPVLEGYNPDVFSILRGLHMQGVAEREAEGRGGDMQEGEGQVQEGQNEAVEAKS